MKNKQTDEDDDLTESKALPQLAQGQTFQSVTGEKVEHWTTPPKPFTEDTLLSAMEHAGQEEYDNETEKKGLGTPATRALIIETLIKCEYTQRNGKQITATERGTNLIAVVPKEVKSPQMTAEWETKLQQIEHGKYSAAAFMQEIVRYVRDLCSKYSGTDETVTFRKPNEPVGKCPHCGSDVLKGQYGYYCKAKCGMNLAKVYGKVLTEHQLMRLLSGKEISFTADGRKTIVIPQAVEHTYNGRTSWQWATKKG